MPVLCLHGIPTTQGVSRKNNKREAQTSKYGEKIWRQTEIERRRHRFKKRHLNDLGEVIQVEALLHGQLLHLLLELLLCESASVPERQAGRAGGGSKEIERKERGKRNDREGKRGREGGREQGVWERETHTNKRHETKTERRTNKGKGKTHSILVSLPPLCRHQAPGNLDAGEPSS